MSTAALLLAARPRPARGPALGKAPLPVRATLISAALHVAVGVLLVVGARAWSAHQPKTYIVNLVPAVAAVGSPQGQAQPTLPPRPEEQPVPRTAPTELPQRDVPRPTIPDMPARSRETVALPDRTAALPERTAALPPRAPGLPRPSDKELPTVASTSKPVPPVPGAVPGRQAAVPAPSRLGQSWGSPAGAGAVTLNVSDFPFAWYLSRVQAKVTERWAGRALQGRQPIAVFDIRRDGQIRGLTIEKTSGNPYYDQAALRAITEATPFPPLPQDYKDAYLRVHLGFNFSPDRG